MHHDFYWHILLGGGLAVLIGVIWIITTWQVSIAKDDERAQRIRKKYGRTAIARKLIRKILWTGETTEQLRDSFDAPVGITRNPLHTSNSEIWEYVGKDADLPDFHITVKDGLVIGWVKIYSKKGKRSNLLKNKKPAEATPCPVDGFPKGK